MYFRVFIKFRVCTCIHDTRYTIHDIDEFRVYTVTSLVRIPPRAKFVVYNLLYFIEWNVKNCFVKLKVLKFNKTKYNSKL